MKQKYISTLLLIAGGLMLSTSVFAVSAVDFRFVNFRWWVNFTTPTVDPCDTVTLKAQVHHDTQSTEARAAVLTWTIDGKTEDVMRKWVEPKGTYSTTKTFKASCTPGDHTVKLTACVVGIGGNINRCSSKLYDFNLTYTVKQPPNIAPSLPVVVKDTGEASGTFIGDVNKPYNFVATARDNDADQLYYEFNWTSDEKQIVRVPDTGSVASGSPKSALYTWTSAGEKVFKVRACDVKRACSQWVSYALTIKAAQKDCSDLGMDIADPPTRFDISDITELGKRLLNLSTGLKKDINGDKKFDISDVVALDQCYLCKWNWKDCK